MLQRIRSIKTIFVTFVILLIFSISLPLLISGIALMNNITYELNTELLSEKLATLIMPIERKYERLRQIGLEDSLIHRQEIKDATLEYFKEFTYRETGSLFVIRSDRIPMLTRDIDLDGEVPRGWHDFVSRLLTHKEEIIHYTINGRKKLAAFRYYAPWDSYIGLSIADSEMFAARNTFVLFNLVVLFLVFIVGLFAMLGLSRLFITPLVRLADYSAQIAGGNYQVNFTGKFVLEFNILKRAMEDMVARIRQKVEETLQQINVIKMREKERDRALLDLSESEERLQSILDNTTSVIYLKDTEGKYLTVNRRFEELFRVSRSNGMGKTDLEIFPHENAESFRANDLLVIERDAPLEFEEFAPHEDGLHTYISVKFPLHNRKGEIYAVGGISTDITSRKQTEEMLAAEQERLAVTLRSIGDGVITTDLEGNIVLLNKVAEELTGWNLQQAYGKPLPEVFRIVNEKTGERCENPADKVLGSGQVFGLANHTTLIARDGTRRSIADSGAPIRDRQSKIIGVVLVFRDVTENKRIEEELLKVKKLESVGVLAGGIAHDFNNILTAIQGNINLAAHLIDINHKAHRLLFEADKATIRAKDLTRQLLTFSKGGEPIRETASIEEVIRDSADFILRGSNIACQYRFPSGLWLVNIDKGQISQVIQNMILNASQAMPSGGKIIIAGSNLENRKKVLVPPLAQGRYVAIMIRDNGAGIPADNIDKIFDPYFTTTEGGSGLGLAVTHSIITKHGGAITVDSKEGSGTTFNIYLPAAAKDVQLAIQVTADEQLRGRGKVLVMDDEEMIRHVASSMLTHFGYEVLLASDGRDALQQYRQALLAGQPVDAVIMDLTIPGGMGGKEAVQEILAIDPEAKVIVSSGYSNDPVMADPKAFGFKEAVVKPYEMQTIGKIVKKVLSGE